MKLDKPYCERELRHELLEMDIVGSFCFANNNV